MAGSTCFAIRFLPEVRHPAAAPRRAATYDEHAQVLRAIVARRPKQAKLVLRAHIEPSKGADRRITIHLLHGVCSAVTKL